MALFLIVPTVAGVGPTIAAALEAKVPGHHRQLPLGEFLASFNGTSKELSDILGITSGAVGQAVVVSISGYFGRAQNDVWEWLAQRGGKTP
jgi:hypothetical protein